MHEYIPAFAVFVVMFILALWSGFIQPLLEIFLICVILLITAIVIAIQSMFELIRHGISPIPPSSK